MKLAYLFAALVALAGSGCGAAAHPGPTRGNVTLFAVNHASSPFALRSVTISMDGEQEETTSARGLQRTEQPIPIGVMTLSPGKHLLSVRASAEDRASEKVLSISVAQPLELDTLPASVTLHVFTPRSGPGTDHSIEVSFALKGGEATAPLGPVAAGASCTRKRGARAALCRLQLQNNEAMASRDILRASCLHDRILELRLLAAVERGASASGKTSRFEQGSDRATADRVQSIEQQAARCAGADMRAGVAGSW